MTIQTVILAGQRSASAQTDSGPDSLSDSILYQRILTPCVGVCSTGIGDSVCRGCKRFDFEVIRWNAYTESEKAAIDRRLAELLGRVVKSRLAVVDVALLERQLQGQQIRYAGYRNPYCWLYELLRAGARQIESPAQYGFAVREAFGDFGLVAIRAAIDLEYYQLSVAHFERYIVANQQRAHCVSP